MLTVMLFAQLAEIHGEPMMSVPRVETVKQLRQTVQSLQPAFGLVGFAVAVNRVIVGPEHIIEGECEIALLPPFSGG